MTRAPVCPIIKKADSKLTAEILRQYVHYDPLTGIFTRRIRSGKWGVGSVVGYKEKRGYVQVSIFRCKMRAHQLAWLYMTGEWPVLPIDHQDCDHGNNRFENLRLATCAENSANRRACVTSSSKVKGAFPYRDGKRWTSTIKGPGRKTIYLGLFDTAEEANAAYAGAAKVLFGEFARAA